MQPFNPKALTIKALDTQVQEHTHIAFDFPHHEDVILTTSKTPSDVFYGDVLLMTVVCLGKIDNQQIEYVLSDDDETSHLLNTCDKADTTALEQALTQKLAHLNTIVDKNALMDISNVVDDNIADIEFEFDEDPNNYVYDVEVSYGRGDELHVSTHEDVSWGWIERNRKHVHIDIMQITHEDEYANRKKAS